MAGKKKELQLQAIISNEEQWNEMMQSSGLTVVDVHQEWSGPCKAVLSLLRKLRGDYGDDVLHFAAAVADNIESLKRFREKCEPVFLLCASGKVVARVTGANAPLLNNTIIEYAEKEKKVLAGEMQASEMLEFKFSAIGPKESAVTIEPETPDELQYEAPYIVAIIKPDAVANDKVEEIKEKVKEAGFIIIAEDNKTLTEEHIRDFYHLDAEKPDFEDFAKSMSSGPCYVLMLSKPEQLSELVPGWQEQSGPTKEQVVEEKKPISLQDVLGTYDNVNICDSEDSREDASRQRDFFFPSLHLQAEIKKIERTLAIIRPDLLKEKRDAVLEKIKQEDFVIVMEKEITLTEDLARLFYHEHEANDFFPILIKHMTSGPILVLALTRENAVQHWRKMLGPKIVEDAKMTDPESLRAVFAVDNIPINQLHGSSNHNEAQKEFEFFFPTENTSAVIKPDAEDRKESQGVLKKETEYETAVLSEENALEINKEGQPNTESHGVLKKEAEYEKAVLSEENALEVNKESQPNTDENSVESHIPETSSS